MIYGVCSINVCAMWEIVWYMICMVQVCVVRWGYTVMCTVYVCRYAVGGCICLCAKLQEKDFAGFGLIFSLLQGFPQEDPIKSGALRLKAAMQPFHRSFSQE